MVGVWWGARRFRLWGVKFFVDVIRTNETVSLSVRLGPPELSTSVPDCWACPFGWDGEEGMKREAFGATSLQSLALAMGLLEISLVSRFPDATFLEDGRPFLLKPAIEAG